MQCKYIFYPLPLLQTGMMGQQQQQQRYLLQNPQQTQFSHNGFHGNMGPPDADGNPAKRRKIMGGKKRPSTEGPDVDSQPTPPFYLSPQQLQMLSFLLQNQGNLTQQQQQLLHQLQQQYRMQTQHQAVMQQQQQQHMMPQQVRTGQQNVTGLVQERRNSIALAMELRLSCTNPSM